MPRLHRLAALAASVAVLTADRVSADFMKAGYDGKMKQMYSKSMAPAVQEVCQTIPVQVDSVCFENVPFKEAYVCPQMVERQVCEKVPMEVADTCYKPTTAMEAYDCGKKDGKKEAKKEECRMVPKQCFKTVTENEEYPCEEEACETVVKRVPQTCFKKKNSKETYTCMKHKKQKVCREVPQQYETTCFQEEAQQSLVPCVGKEEKNAVSFEEKCTLVQNQIDATCERQVMTKEQYTCTKKEVRRECSLVPQKVTETCEELVEEQKPYKCKKKQMAQKCKLETVSVPSTCEKKKGDKSESYACEKKVKQEVCKDVEENVEAVCYQLVSVKKAVPCKKMAESQVCVDKEVEVPSTCYRDVPTMETYPCKKTVNGAPSCTKIPMCAHFTTQKKAYPCLETKMSQECHVEEVPVEDTCTRQFTEEVPYDCSKEIKAKECRMVPKTCKKKVTRDVAFECSEKVCEKVSAPQVCYRKAKAKEAYPCTRTEYTEQCHMQPQLISKTCYSQGVKPQKYPCKETKYETICKQIVQKATIESIAVPEAVGKEKKGKGKKAKR